LHKVKISLPAFGGFNLLPEAIVSAPSSLPAYGKVYPLLPAGRNLFGKSPESQKYMSSFLRNKLDISARSF
jgi:hypothetical protein